MAAYQGIKRGREDVGSQGDQGEVMRLNFRH